MAHVAASHYHLIAFFFSPGKKPEEKREDKTRAYKLACLILSVLCLILLLLVIFLSSKREYQVSECHRSAQHGRLAAALVVPFLNSTHRFLSILVPTGSHFCPENELRTISPTCSLETCQTLHNLPSNSEFQEEYDTRSLQVIINS